MKIAVLVKQTPDTESVIKLKPEVIPEYKRIHAAVWPEVLKAIRDSNIRNYTIFLKEPENILFAYWEYHGHDFDADMKKMALVPRMQAWWRASAGAALKSSPRSRICHRSCGSAAAGRATAARWEA